MKHLFRHLLRRAGYELLHCTDDPVLGELRTLHETLRLDSRNHLRLVDTLSQPAAHACFRALLELHDIDLVIDVGANQGQFAQLIRRLGYRGEIVSFEPLPRYREQLSALAAADQHWRVMPIALGREAAELELHVYQDDSFSSLHAINQAGQARFSALVTPVGVVRVPVRRLDEMRKEIGLDPSRRVLLKTDTQGHDLAVLEGALDTLGHTQAVITEIAFEPIYADVPVFAELAGWLRARGFVTAGLFPISHHPQDLAVIEMDCAFTRPTPASAQVRI